MHGFRVFGAFFCGLSVRGGGLFQGLLSRLSSGALRRLSGLSDARYRKRMWKNEEEVERNTSGQVVDWKFAGLHKRAGRRGDK